MRSKSEVYRMIPAKLVDAVIEQLSANDDAELESTLTNIMNHGIDGGFHGFIYTRNTVTFFKDNRREIIELAMSQADDFGTDVVNMIASFNCLGRQDKKAQREYLPSVQRCVAGFMNDDDDDDVMNALAWFAAEEVARAFCDD